MMVKAAVIGVALYACTAVHGFVPTSTRIAPSLRQSSSTGTSCKGPAFAHVHRCVGGERSIRTSRTSLFSAPTASSEQVPAASTAVPTPETSSGAVKQAPGPLRVGAYFGLWYLLNIGYNIYNKRLLNAYPLPWLVAAAQMAGGLLYFLPLWMSGLRKPPKLYKGALRPLSQLALMHTLAHVTAVVALGAGAVSFTHIVKAAEPVFTSAFSAALLGQTFALPVYLSLIPVIFGVSLASMKELTFSWVAFGNAMGSNTASALRGILGKKQMGKPVGDNMSAANLYAVLTVMASIVLTPVALIVEGAKAVPGWKETVATTGYTSTTLGLLMVLTGLLYYFYNEVAFLALDSVNPVTHAVGNTIKRVVIIVATCLVFRNPMSPLSIAGSAIAILGTLLYSLTKARYAKK